jgi:RHS repeat-associated protein
MGAQAIRHRMATSTQGAAMKIMIRIAVAFFGMAVFTAGFASESSVADDSTHDSYPGDFNGDGQLDALYVARHAGGDSGIAISGGAGPNMAWQSWDSAYLGIAWFDRAYLPIVADFNGDGRSDIFMQCASAGASYLLTADEQGRFTGISQAIPDGFVGVLWTADQHTAVAGDFDGNGTADLFLQARGAAALNLVLLTDENGQFTSAPQQAWEEGYLGLPWSSEVANAYAGDFNGDGTSDLLIQALDQPEAPGAEGNAGFNGVVFAQAPDAEGAIFRFGGQQLWERSEFGVDWSPEINRILIADLNGDGRADIYLHPVGSSAGGIVLAGNSEGIAFSAGSASPLSAEQQSLLNPLQGFAPGSVAGAVAQSADLVSEELEVAAINEVGSEEGQLAAAATVTPTAVGRTVGSFAISHTGSATYSIPIVVPKGVAGLQPALTLSYASGVDDGLLGIGWNVTGLSEISRCKKTPVQDGSTDSVLLTTADRFCLDGNKLRRISGTYGADGSTYRTEIDQISLVTAVGTAGNGPASFTVEAKNGLTYEYGNTSNSRIEVIGSTTPRTWALNRVTDRAGNYLTVTYVESTTNGSFRPNEITYTANTAAGLAAAYKVTFVWEARPASDTLIEYFAGGMIKVVHRLNRLETKYNDPVLGWRVVRTYQLGYETSTPTQRSRLTSVQECDGAGDCLSPTTISWVDGTAGWSGTNTSSTSGSTAMMEYAYPVDFDGDGRDDLVYPQFSGSTAYWYYLKATTAGGFAAPVNTNLSAGTAAAPAYAYAVPIDYATEGRRGLLTNTSGTGVLQILRWNGTAFVLTPTNVTYTMSGREWVSDFDGDAREDFMYATSASGTGTFSVRKNSGTAISSPQFAAATSFYSTSLGSAVIDAFHNGVWAVGDRVLDFNGDGRADFIYQSTQGGCLPPPNLTCTWTTTWNVLQSTGTSFQLLDSWTCSRVGPNSPSCPVVPAVGDYNGDGLTDFIATFGSHTPTSMSYEVFYGSGAGITAPVVLSLPTNFNPGGFTSDYDGDGRSDILYAPSATSGTWSIIRSTGSGFEAAVSLTIPSGTENDTVRALDLDGDGLKDIGFKSTAYRVRKHNGDLPDLVSSITDGFGNDISITYAPLTDASIYTKGSGSTYPQMEVQAPIHTVKQITSSNGIGSTYDVTATYTGARVHVQGRGYLGFSSRTETDSRTGIKSTWNFQQAFPYIGAVSQLTTNQPSSGPIIARTTDTYQNIVLSSTVNNDRYLPYVSSSVQRTYEVGGADDGDQIAQVTTATTIDNYGNPTEVTVTTVDSTSGQTFVTEKVNTIPTYDTANWCVDRVTAATVTSTVPSQAAQTRTSNFTHDYVKCRATQQVVEPSSAQLKVTTALGYDAFGNANSQTVTGVGMAARTTTTSFGTAGVFPVSVTNALSQTATKTWDYALGVPLTATDPNNLIVAWEYDGFGRKTLETRPDNTETRWTLLACNSANSYCGGGSLVRYQTTEELLSTSGSVIRYAVQKFDLMSRVKFDQTQTLSGGLSTVRTNYNNRDLISQRSAPYLSGGTVYYTTNTYDVTGRLTQEQRQISEGNTGTQTTVYGYAKLVHTLTDANGKVTTKTMNALGQVVQVKDAANGITTYKFDPFGNLLETTDPASNKIVSTFDIRGFKRTTSDPDMGSWTYTPNALGELVTQVDAKSQTANFTYDKLSRPLTRVEAEGTTTWVWGNSSTAKNIGQLESVTSPGAYSEVYAYDSLGRPQQVTTGADAGSYVVTNTYSTSTGLLHTVTYPTSTSAVPGSRFKVQYDYAYGMLEAVKDFATPTLLYWQAVSTNAAGQVTDEQLGNGLHTLSDYDAITSLLGTRTSGTASAVQNLSYQWDKVGNLTQRQDVNTSLIEDFTYDNLNRLKTSQLNGVTNLSLTYAANGNISTKSDVGTYAYPTQGAGSVRPHAVSTAGGNSFSYDANGNMNVRNGSAIAWTSYNLPSNIAKGGNSAQFSYGASRARYKQVAVTAAGGSLPAGTETTIYIGGLFEKVTKPSGVLEYKHYVLAGKEPVAIKTLRSNSANDVRYLHKDHLGSVDAITNESGAVVLRLSNDAFGKRRNPGTWAGTPTASQWSSIAAITHRAFTFHEGLDNVDLIHMNGRVYDPLIGRFISADPIIQAPLMSQSLNRYSYVMNNPLSMIDPSGYSWLSKLWKAITGFFKKFWRPIVAIIAAAFTAGLAYGAYMSAYAGTCVAPGVAATAGAIAGATAGATFGATITALSGGSIGDVLKAAVIGGITGAIGGGIAGYGQGSLTSRMFAGALNGGLQTGTPEGFFRGMLSGFIPSDLGMSSAYNRNPWANAAISVGRDAARGYIIDGSDGARRSVGWGLSNNLVGHAVGLSFGGGHAPAFKDGMWIYSANVPGTSAITLGNVVSMSPDIVSALANNNSAAIETLGHEGEHATSQSALGAAYLPAHMASQWVFGSLFGGQWAFMEQRPFLNQYPYGERLGAL